MERSNEDRKSGHALYTIVLAVEEMLGSELTGEELAELVSAADPPSEDHHESRH